MNWTWVTYLPQGRLNVATTIPDNPLTLADSLDCGFRSDTELGISSLNPNKDLVSPIWFLLWRFYVLEWKTIKSEVSSDSWSYQHPMLSPPSHDSRAARSGLLVRGFQSCCFIYLQFPQPLLIRSSSNIQMSHAISYGCPSFNYVANCLAQWVLIISERIANVSNGDYFLVCSRPWMMVGSRLIMWVKKLGPTFTNPSRSSSRPS